MRRYLVLNPIGIMWDFVSNDFLKTNLSAGFTALNGDSRTVIVLLKQEEVADNIYLGSGYLSTREYGNSARGFGLVNKKYSNK